MPKWKKYSKEFEVGVNYVDWRGYLSSIPKPVMKGLETPNRIKFVVNKVDRIEIHVSK